MLVACGVVEIGETEHSADAVVAADAECPRRVSSRRRSLPHSLHFDQAAVAAPDYSVDDSAAFAADVDANETSEPSHSNHPNIPPNSRANPQSYVRHSQTIDIARQVSIVPRGR